MSAKISHIIISRIDNIGDVVLTLPMAGLLKQHYPDCKITLMARSYTKPLAQACINIDNFVDWEKLQQLPEPQIISEIIKLQATTIIHLATGNQKLNKRLIQLAKKARITQRIGRLENFYNWLYCNKLVRQSKRHSKLHEAQLNLKLLKPLGIINHLPTQQLAQYINLQVNWPLPLPIAQLLDQRRFNLIIHPGSHGHGREWPLSHYKALIQGLPQDKFKIFLTGSKEEQQRFQELIESCPETFDMMGSMSLEELMAFIAKADGLIASGTGPLHLAAALAINTLGLFPPRLSINPQRWAPVGQRAQYLVEGESCNGCSNSAECSCMQAIAVAKVARIINNWHKMAMP